MTVDDITDHGPYYNFDKVPIALRPLQQPNPPFWYGSSGAEGSTWAGERGLHFVTLGPNDFAKANIDSFKEVSAKQASRPAEPKPEFCDGVASVVQRHNSVDGTGENAKRWGKLAMDMHLGHLNRLRVRHGVTATQMRMRNVRGTTYEECIEEGTVIAGSPKTVLAEIEKQMAQIGANYLLTYMFLGNMSLADAMRSLKLFKADVMPKVARL